MSHFFLPVLSLITLILLFACSKSPDFEVENFNPISNLYQGIDTVEISVEIPDNIFEGIKIPHDRFLKIKFDIKNNSDTDRKYYYKIYYRNESYKYPVNIGMGDTVKYNHLAAENFYGSWSPVSDSFHLSPIIRANGNLQPVTDSFCIVGNPRDEGIYFGKHEDEMIPDLEKIETTIKFIEDSPEWYKTILEKALLNKRSNAEQMYLDALWVLRNDRDKGNTNNRWKRNPRAGTYSFLLVVLTEEQLVHLPVHVKNIGKKAGDTLFQDPYYYFYHDPLNQDKNFTLIKSSKYLKVKVKFDLSRGIYINPLEFTNPSMDLSSVRQSCNLSDDLYKKAQIQQFFHNIDKNFIMQNIPVVENLQEISQSDYDLYTTKYKDEDMVNDYIRISGEPCNTVEYSESEQAVLLKNPASDYKKMGKENVGIQSRVGFTYGRITAKIKFPEMLNKHNVWNGITNAFWLIYHKDGQWNYRRPCEDSGYIPKNEVGQTDVRIPSSYYTEIDIEIVKASKHWPPSSYYNNIPFPGGNDPDSEEDIIVTCTNWDLACNEPDSFNVGVFGVQHLDKEFYPHRWDHWYKALTMKYAVNHSSIFERDYYYYQIDWQPDFIVWRIGPEKDQMFEIGYLDTSVTNIPNNQMTFIVTQEYHHSEWWPTTPFKQEFIPYPSNEIVGKVYEVEIE